MISTVTLVVFRSGVLVVSSGVVVVVDVSNSPFFGGALLSGSDCEIVEPQSFSPQPSIEAMQLQMDVEDQEFASEDEYRWTARDREVIAKMEQHLDRSESTKLEIEALELLLGPEDSEVYLRFFVMNSRKKKGLEDLRNLQLAGSE